MSLTGAITGALHDVFQAHPTSYRHDDSFSSHLHCRHVLVKDCHPVMLPADVDGKGLSSD